MKLDVDKLRAALGASETRALGEVFAEDIWHTMNRAGFTVSALPRVDPEKRAEEQAYARMIQMEFLNSLRQHAWTSEELRNVEVEP